MRRTKTTGWLLAAIAGGSPVISAGETHRPIEEIIVVGRADDLVGVAPSASAGRAGRIEIARTPFLRTGEVLEVVPGLIATQHSGTGKANQYFLRGFNLDHGTDFSTSLEGVPLNLPSHGHGQGYLDISAVIPELIHVVDYRKGPYYADVGDFSSAGTARIDYVRRLPRPTITVGFGQDGYFRGVVGTSARLGGGDLLLAGEAQAYDGPWDLEENLEKRNGVMKWTRGDEAGGFSIFLNAYDAKWRSTDQIALRAVRNGQIGRLGHLDDDLGGSTTRLTASSRWWLGVNDPTEVRIYAARYDFDLWSNFTYFLDDPENGDEFQQIDERTVVGFDASQGATLELGGREIFGRLGLDVRHDRIDDVGLFRTVSRAPIEIVRRDDARVTTFGMWSSVDTTWTTWLRSTAGMRGDLWWANVDASANPENSAGDFDGIASPKVGIAMGPWAATELYGNYGRGFHSNDARGATIRIDPASGEPTERVDPLVATQGAEIGFRTSWIPDLRSTVALWWLELDSELVFVGDAGGTEATRPSRRMGVELANHWNPLPWLHLQGDATFTDSRFRDDDPAGDDIPGAIKTTLVAAAAVDFRNGAYGAVRIRHFGARPLIEDGSVESDPTTLVNLQCGWVISDLPWGTLALTLDVLNLFDSKDDDIAYFYASRLPGEPTDGIEDVHFHPVEPRTFRGYASWKF